jgi:ATP-dependent Clp protease ATP-binding subunit ClpA
MTSHQKIDYYDLREEAREGRLPSGISRVEEKERLTRVIGRSLNNNAIVIGPGGIGKTTFVYGWLKELAEQEPHASLQLIQFDAEQLIELDANSETEEAMESLPESILFIDSFGRAVHNNSVLLQQLFRIFKSILKESKVRVVVTLEPHEYEWLERVHPAFVQLFETITLKNQSVYDYVKILQSALPEINAKHRVVVPTAALEEIISLVARFPILGQMPKAGIGLLDESISLIATRGGRFLESSAVAEVVAGKTGIPHSQLSSHEMDTLGNLEEQLNARIINQKNAIAKIATTLQRAKLGLRNPNKPLGSFLLLGPSGVGKTETAKLIAETMFGRSESFIRFDMSEFQQDHTIQRLIGAPAGYVGYEEGGALTNALRKEPHCLILLDEIEKAHPKVFDIFLQVLDDGRLTSGQNETVDARNAIIMATSNVAVDEILKAFEQKIDVHSEAFTQQRLIPVLADTFRLEFINRFDNVLVFNPLTLAGLVQIAQLEVKKIEKRLAKHRVTFEIDARVIEEKIKGFVDPHFGARPVKRFIEETCESLLMQSLLSKNKARAAGSSRNKYYGKE